MQSVLYGSDRGGGAPGAPPPPKSAPDITITIYNHNYIYIYNVGLHVHHGPSKKSDAFDLGPHLDQGRADKEVL